MRPYLKDTQHKNRAGMVAQVLELLPSKCEALSSNPVPHTKKRTCKGIHCLQETAYT
jgi:hypothetical protein